MRWSVIVPVKRLSEAKSRLFADPGRALPDRTALGLALALDTVTAVLAAGPVARVLVVTDDEVAAAPLRTLGATVLGDEPDGGLNAALVHGAAEARRTAPDAPVAVLVADVAALRTHELAAALAVAGSGRHFVPDSDGVGTTMLAAGPGVPLDPRFGGPSRRAHLRSGAAEIGTALASLRCDIDTPAALDRARSLGLGPHLARLLG